MMTQHRKVAPFLWFVLRQALLQGSLLLTTTTIVHGFYAPPHPNYTEWETVHQMRRRLNVTYSYKPQYIPNEYCRYLTEEECQIEDAHYKNKRTTEQRRRAQATTSGTNIRALVLLIKFSDHTSRTVPPKSYLQELFNGKRGTDINPIGSIRDYLYINSVGQYNGTKN